ncbi:hypothetical protein Gorai_010382, partial [Gossypium raimondii]|nr:hypothetical protein [Gossypium raimondii]
MGGCCCCSSRGVENSAPADYCVSIISPSLEFFSFIFLFILTFHGVFDLLCFEFGFNPRQVQCRNTRASDRHVPLSSRNATASALSTGLLVDTNLEVSVPDAYQPPPAPIPFDAALGHPLTPSAAQGIHSSKSNEAVQTTNIGSGQETIVVNTQETFIKSDDAKELDCKAQNTTENESSKELEIELPKPVESIVPTKEEEDCCPTCLE